MTIPTGFKPNLAATLTKPELIKFPVWASPKIDGIRCVFFGGVAYSRSLKPIPNPVVQEFAAAYRRLLEGLDGELTVGSPTDSNCMQNSMAVMSKSAEPDFTFHVFDVYDGYAPFEHRGDVVEDRIMTFYDKYPEADIKAVPQHLCACAADLDKLEARFLADGYEGMMIRAHDGKYKCGRSTEREGGLVKVKRFVDGEAVIVGFEEEMHNANEAKRDATGRTERSTSKAGLHGKGTLGALVVKNEKGIVFNIGTGFTAAQRADYWANHPSLFGKIVKFKHFDHGTVDAPRHPVFIGFRHPEDMG
ncbi:ATP-dependent DNA ligase [Burkholderia cepacia]|uniref:ATP-dependent DNA ligase n=1 Tax=Burkholderia cepacia TaxID=292 RepID=UPI000756999D|nr:ATP-dependent DNA ligase [Burkholderia cepacia]KVV54039.1 ATP-dependent DNA ligase [Burkholderia cepacia]KVV62613.1 ATP-dependent DNA ligase [Burkholderia cepacia]KVV67993.1 ATP-dependent DNA ligase [Burkholderia cepacia]KVV75519.1 ATP-dependent DNA ligase [Burkholderia cepacia]KVV79181.1 ATP-dependent DNA ligase [Burkholderia cepacia]